MNDGWLDITLGEFVRLQRGHDLTDSDRRPGNVPVMGAAGMNGYHDAAIAKGPGVVIGRSGASFGKAHYCAEDYWPHNTALYVTDFLGNDPRFAYYFLESYDFSGYNSGSAQPSLNRNFLYRIPVRVPKPPEQRAIAKVLGALDDRIELNRRMNETLEAIAQAIFKSWFVDFDPVRAKAAGQTPQGLDLEVGALFPDRLEQSDLGEIPAGWRIGTLGDIAENPRRGVEPREIDPSTPYVALEHMPRRCIALSDWGQARELESNKFEFKRGEILFGKLRPYFHKVGIAPLNGICSTDILVVVPKQPEWFGLVVGHVSSVIFVNHTDASATGTKMPRTNWGDMGRYQVALPPIEIGAAFTERISPLVARIIANIHESHTLASVREALLPKLLSGEIKLTERN